MKLILAVNNQKEFDIPLNKLNQTDYESKEYGITRINILI